MLFSVNVLCLGVLSICLSSAPYEPVYVLCLVPHTASNYAQSKETMRQFNLL